jgi:hypothetical protein
LRNNTDEKPISSNSDAKSTPQLYLWENAYDKLRDKKGDLVDAWEAVLAKNADVQEDLPLKEKMSTVINKELLIITNRQWKIRILKDRNPVLVRELIDKIVHVFQKVKDLGSAAASIDPVHAGIPFAGICVLVPVSDRQIPR